MQFAPIYVDSEIRISMVELLWFVIYSNFQFIIKSYSFANISGVRHLLTLSELFLVTTLSTPRLHPKILWICTGLQMNRFHTRYFKHLMKRLPSRSVYPNNLSDHSIQTAGLCPIFFSLKNSLFVSPFISRHSRQHSLLVHCRFSSSFCCASMTWKSVGVFWLKSVSVRQVGAGQQVLGLCRNPDRRDWQPFVCKRKIFFSRKILSETDVNSADPIWMGEGGERVWRERVGWLTSALH